MEEGMMPAVAAPAAPRQVRYTYSDVGKAGPQALEAIRENLKINGRPLDCEKLLTDNGLTEADLDRWRELIIAHPNNNLLVRNAVEAERNSDERVQARETVTRVQRESRDQLHEMAAQRTEAAQRAHDMEQRAQAAEERARLAERMLAEAAIKQAAPRASNTPLRGHSEDEVSAQMAFAHCYGVRVEAEIAVARAETMIRDTRAQPTKYPPNVVGKIRGQLDKANKQLADARDRLADTHVYRRAQRATVPNTTTEQRAIAVLGEHPRRLVDSACQRLGQELARLQQGPAAPTQATQGPPPGAAAPAAAPAPAPAAAPAAAAAAAPAAPAAALPAAAAAPAVVNVDADESADMDLEDDDGGDDDDDAWPYADEDETAADGGGDDVGSGPGPNLIPVYKNGKVAAYVQAPDDGQGSGKAKRKGKPTQTQRHALKADRSKAPKLNYGDSAGWRGGRGGRDGGRGGRGGSRGNGRRGGDRGRSTTAGSSAGGWTS